MLGDIKVVIDDGDDDNFYGPTVQMSGPREFTDEMVKELSARHAQFRSGGEVQQSFLERLRGKPPSSVFFAAKKAVIEILDQRRDLRNRLWTEAIETNADGREIGPFSLGTLSK